MQDQQWQFTMENLIEGNAGFEQPFEEADIAVFAANQAEHICIYRLDKGHYALMQALALLFFQMQGVGKAFEPVSGFQYFIFIGILFILYDMENVDGSAELVG